MGVTFFAFHLFVSLVCSPFGSTMTRTSAHNTTSMRQGTASIDASGASTTTGTNPAPLSVGVRYRRRHLNNTLV